MHGNVLNPVAKRASLRMLLVAREIEKKDASKSIMKADVSQPWTWNESLQLFSISAPG